MAIAIATVGALPALGQGFPSLPSIYAHYSADSAANLTVAPLNTQFTAYNVDISGQKINLTGLGFGAISYPNGIGPATPVYFSSTGVLPSPLQANTPYYIVTATGGGYTVFPVATDADAPYQPGGVSGELTLPAQNVAQGVRNVIFTDGGTGTHTITTKTLLRQLTDLTTNGFNSAAVSSTNKHTFLELDSDANGNWFFRTAGATARENFVGSYNTYGQTLVQTGSKYAARQQVGNKRVVYQIYVCRVRSFKERQVVKILDGPGNINISTDQIDYVNAAMDPDKRMTGKFVTGDLIRVKATADSVLPSPLAEGVNYYARKVTTTYMTLHPTAADATANTNVIDLTTTGSGSFLFYDPLRVGDYKRWSFFTEMLAPNSGANTLSARLVENLPTAQGITKIPTAFIVSGANNGNVAGLSSVPDLTPVVLWTPPGATLPAPLQAGVLYWTTKVPNSTSNGRLHASFTSAQESIGKTTAASSCIKYTSAGTGECLVSYNDDASYIGYGTLESAVEPFTTRVPLGPLCVLVFKIDFNDPNYTNALATIGVNEAVTEQKVLSFARGNTPAAVSDGQPAWTLFNSAQGHVPIDLDCYEIVFGSSTDAVPDSDIQTVVDYLRNKYEVDSPSPISLRTWRYNHFGTCDAVGAAKDLADPDGDGIPNLIEYAVGSDPITNGIGQLAQGFTADGSRLTFTFPRIADPTIKYKILASSDLTEWQTVWESSGVSNIMGNITVEDVQPIMGSSKRFLRLCVGY